MRFHDTLNEKLWDLNTQDLIPEVKEKLFEIANAFIEYIEIPQDAILDMVITGSSASYNYNEFSDLDLHIIVDYDKIHEDCPLVEGYLGALKNTFNKEHDITIHDVPVELYAEKKDQGTVHNGLYSLNTGWIDKPEKIKPTDNDAAVEAKFNEIKEMVDKCNDSEEATELLEKIYNMRKAGLAEAGEFCTENLAFKKLRNEGCMDKLRQIKKEQIDKQLSLESYTEENESDEDKYLRLCNLRRDVKSGLTNLTNLLSEPNVDVDEINQEIEEEKGHLEFLNKRIAILRNNIDKQLSLESYNESNERTFADWFGKDLTGQTYEGDIDCHYKQLTSLKGSPKKVIGNFNCSENKLKDLYGSPKEVTGDFNCSVNYLSSIKDAPKKVGGSFYCRNNNLTSLQGSPRIVPGTFNCEKNQLRTLQGGPEKVGKSFWCNYNNLTSLEGAPQKVGDYFNCSDNELTSLKGAPQKVNYFICIGNKLTSLQGAPQIVNITFSCRNNKLNSLEYSPKKLSGDFDCSYNQLTSLKGGPVRVDGRFECTNNRLTSMEGTPKKVGKIIFQERFSTKIGLTSLESYNESIKESEDELTLEDKLINILTKDGWNHLNGRGGESLEKDNTSISLYVDSVIFNEFEDDEKELPLETEEDLQNILNQINELKKNESVDEEKEYENIVIFGAIPFINSKLRDANLLYNTKPYTGKTRKYDGVLVKVPEDDTEGFEMWLQEQKLKYADLEDLPKNESVNEQYVNVSSSIYIITDRKLVNEMLEVAKTCKSIYDFEKTEIAKHCELMTKIKRNKFTGVDLEELVDNIRYTYEDAYIDTTLDEWEIEDNKIRTGSILVTSEDDYYYESLEKFHNNIKTALGEEMEERIYFVEYNYEDNQPGLAIGTVKVKASSEEEALDKAAKYAAQKHPGVYTEDSCRIVEQGFDNDEIIESNMDEDVATLEKKIDVAQDTLKELIKSITVQEEFDFEKAYKNIEIAEALQED